MTALAPVAPAGRSGVSRLRLGVIATLVLLLCGFVSIVWTPYPIGAIDIGAALAGPSSAHWFGTDQLGRDVLSLTMKGMLTSFVLAAVATFIGAVLGVPLGVAAARLPGSFDRAILGATGLMLAFPALILGVVLAGAFGPSMLTAVLAIGMFNVPGFTRITLSGVRIVQRFNFVAAARLAGTGAVETARRHILPSLLPLMLAQAVAQLAIGVMAEAVLSFVGIGVQPPASSLGLVLRDAQGYALMQPVPMLLVGLVLVLIVLSLNLWSGGLRDGLDPKLRRMDLDDDAA
jgi:peptide/nickel transport system permease protein